MKKFLSKMGVFIMVLSLSLFALFACSPKPQEVKTVTKGDGVNLKVGIISDTQLAHTPTYSYGYEQNLKLALDGMKARGVETVIFAGDFGNLLSDYMYQGFQRVWNSVYEESNAPEKVFIMGNHDYWFENDYNGQLPKKQKMFQKFTGESPWSHKVINGYHFIAYSPTKSASYKEKEKWFNAELAKAMQDGDKPIFVITHHNPVGTVYGSVAVDGGEGWGLAGLDELFRGNERIVSISGHSHYSIVDERSIDQDTYTAFQTQSLSYTELEGGKENGSVPPNSEANPMMMIMNLSPEKAEIERISVRSGEVQGDNWVLPFPLKKETFTYTTQARLAAAVAPTMMDSDIIVTDGVDKDGAAAKFIGFQAAVGNEKSFVHSYHITLSQNGVQKYFYRYFSDFHLGTANMSKDCLFKLNKEIATGEYEIKIEALESFGKKSANALAGNIRI